MPTYSDYDRIISEYENAAKKWEGRTEKILKKFRAEDSSRRSNLARFNILWSNIQILVPATFSRIPKPDVSRRYKDNDPVGRVACLLLERALEYEVSAEQDFPGAMRNAVQDRFLGGRGVAWVRYEPTFEEQEGEAQITEDAEAESRPMEVLSWEHSPVDYVHWRDRSEEHTSELQSH